MFEFEFEGELLPFIVNGDRFELLTLLPRRKPRTERNIAAAIFPFRGQPSLTAVTITSRVCAMSIGFRVLGCGGVSATAMQPHPQRGGGLPPAVFVFVSADAVAGHKAPPSAMAVIQRERPLYRLEHRCRNRCSSTSTRAKGRRTSKTETDSRRKRCGHAGSHGQNGRQHSLFHH